jgi:hypothetical protein
VGSPESSKVRAAAFQVAARRRGSSGAAPPPTDVFLKVVDLIVEKDLDALRRN